MAKPGRKPKHPLDRISSKVKINNKIRNLRYWVNRPLPDWFKESPWVWTGATSGEHKYLQRSRSTTKWNHYRASPRMSGVPSVPRYLFEAFRRPLAPEERLRYHMVDVSDRLDVNPYHWEPTVTRTNQYPYTESDFDLTREIEEADDELAQFLEEEYALQPFNSWDELQTRFSAALFDVSEEELLQALERAGLLHRLS